METRPMPSWAIVVMCTLLFGAASVMAWQSVALAADGAYQLVLVVGSGDVWGLDARILAAWTHQAAVVLALRAGVTDTQLLSILLGVGQLLVPAVAWSVAVVLSRGDRLVCAAVAMIAALNAGTTWFVSVSEIVLAVPLTTLVAVLLWRPGTWRARDIGIAVVASAVLVASYETAVLTGAVLMAWAAWRATRAPTRTERIACATVATLSLASVVVALSGTRSGANPTHSQSLLYYVVSLEPWPFYAALAGIATVIAPLGWSTGRLRGLLLALGCGALAIAILGLEPSAVTAFQARGGAAITGFMLELFLLWRWIAARAASGPAVGEPPSRLLVAIPVVAVVAMVTVNVGPVSRWARSLDAFRDGVNASAGVTDVADVLPPDRGEVRWGWTSTSLSLLVRGEPSAGVLVDPNPSIVPFAPGAAREQIPDEYTWRG
jgi:hypothetical protein